MKYNTYKGRKIRFNACLNRTMSFHFTSAEYLTDLKNALL